MLKEVNLLVFEGAVRFQDSENCLTSLKLMQKIKKRLVATSYSRQLTLNVNSGLL